MADSMTLDEQLDALLHKHDLDSISITRQRSSAADDRETFTCTSVRSVDGHYDVTTQGAAAEQLSQCISTVIARRSMQPVSLSPLVQAAA